MSKTWIWILGILAALIIVSLGAAAIFFTWDHWPVTDLYIGKGLQAEGTPAPDDTCWQQGLQMPFGHGMYGGYHMGGWGWHMPMMHHGGFFGFGGFAPFGMGFFVVIGLLKLMGLGFLALVAYFFYQMGKRAGMSATSSSPPPNRTLPPARKIARR